MASSCCCLCCLGMIERSPAPAVYLLCVVQSPPRILVHRIAHDGLGTTGRQRDVRRTSQRASDSLPSTFLTFLPTTRLPESMRPFPPLSATNERWCTRHPVTRAHKRRHPLPPLRNSSARKYAPSPSAFTSPTIPQFRPPSCHQPTTKTADRAKESHSL